MSERWAVGFLDFVGRAARTMHPMDGGASMGVQRTCGARPASEIDTDLTAVGPLLNGPWRRDMMT